MSVMSAIGEFFMIVVAKMDVPGVALAAFGLLILLATLWILGVTTLTVLYPYFIGLPKK